MLIIIYHHFYSLIFEIIKLPSDPNGVVVTTFWYDGTITRITAWGKCISYPNDEHRIEGIDGQRKWFNNLLKKENHQVLIPFSDHEMVKKIIPPHVFS